MYDILCVVVLVSAVNQVQSTNKDLLLGFGDILTINTTVPEAYLSKVQPYGNSIQLTISPREEIATVGGNTWPYKYAELVFEGDVVLKRGSVVNVNGKYGLSIQSVNGDITIRSNISMTCAVNATAMDMCLGGYAQRLKCLVQWTQSVPGAGPGCLTSDDCYSVSAIEPKSAAGHGGKGAGARKGSTSVTGWYYERENINALIGGSSGWYFKKSLSKTLLMPRSGGGAIELQADNGTITLSSKISASAQNFPSKNETYSGSSGGRIRLKARKVILQPNSRLEVDGSPGSMFRSFHSYGFLSAGGAGGVVQIIAASVKIEQIGAISMKPGSSIGTNLTSDPGFLLIKDYSGKFYKTWNSSWSFPNVTYSIGETSDTVKYCQPNSLQTPLIPLIVQDPTDEQIRQILLRSSCLKNKSGSINTLELVEYFARLATDFLHVVTNQSLTRTQLDRSVEALTELKDIYIILANTSQVNSNLWDLFHNVSRIVDGILDPRNKQIWNDSKLITMLDLMDEISEITAGKTLRSSQGTVARLDYLGTNMAIQIVKYNQADFEGFTLPINTRQTTDTSSQDSVILPHEAISTLLTPTDDVSVVIKVYKDVEGIFPRAVDSSIRYEKNRAVFEWL